MNTKKCVHYEVLENNLISFHRLPANSALSRSTPKLSTPRQPVTSAKAILPDRV